MNLRPAAAFEAIPFLRGGGALGQLIATHDWRATELGDIAAWPPHVCTATALMLRSVVPIVMLWGESGVMVYNDAYSRFAESRHPRLLGSPVREGWPEVADFNDNVMRVGLSGGTLSYVDQELTLHRHGRAEQVWMNLDYSPLLGAEGEPVGVMAIVVETTAKVLAERQLKGERERFAQLFEQAPSFMAMLEGPEHRIVLANPSYLRQVGRQDLLGRPMAEAQPELAPQGILALLDDVYRSGEVFSAEAFRYLAFRSPGEAAVERYVDFVAQPIRGADGRVTGIFVEGVDVTSRVLSRQLREHLVRLADRLRDLGDPGDVAGAAAELLGQVLQVQHAGYGRIDADGADDADDGSLRTLRAWHAPGTPTPPEGTADRFAEQACRLVLDSLKSNAVVAIGDVRSDARTAALAEGLATAGVLAFVQAPVLEQGRLVAVLQVLSAEVRDWTFEQLSFIREVAERTWAAVTRAEGEAALRLSETRLREANETLEVKVEARGRELMEIEAKFRHAQKMEAIGQLTGGIAHDFNNLLHGLGTSLEILARRLQTGLVDDADRYIGMAQRAVRRAASLTQRLLAFSRRQTLDPQATDLNQLVAELEELVRSTVGSSIVVTVQPQDGLWPTWVDAPQLENALLNLCINARDAMRERGGQLTIATANVEVNADGAARIELPAGAYVRLSVTDTGMGMTPDVLARVFDPFFTTKPLGEGTGLGLSMVYGFVRQSGGQVRIVSAPGQGTTMHLYLPRHVARAEAETVALPAADAAPRQPAILLIDDDATIRALLVEQLQEAGYRVIAAANGPEGLALLQSDAQIDLLVSDVGLPGGLNGRQVADAGRVVRPGLRVLFITGYVEHGRHGDGLLGRGMGLITKPFEFAQLAEKVRAMLA